MKIVKISYFNVVFYLVIRTESEMSMFQIIKNKIQEGKPICMKEIKDWCIGHGIEFKSRFFYRRDFSLRANIWNLYSYIRFRIEKV